MSGPHLFRLTIEAFCPALFKTSFHSSSSPRIMYLKDKREYQSLLERKGGCLKENKLVTTSLSDMSCHERQATLCQSLSCRENRRAVGPWDVEPAPQTGASLEQGGSPGLPAGIGDRTVLQGRQQPDFSHLTLINCPLPSWSLLLPQALELCLSPPLGV